MDTALLDRPQSEAAAATPTADTTSQQDTTTEAALLERFAAGDASAFDRLMEIHQESGFWAAVRLVHDDDTARDVVQDAFIRVMRNRHRYDQRRPFRAWFLRIVRNLAIDHLRRRRHELQDMEIPHGVTHNAAEDMERREMRRRIDEVLLTLPEKYHDLLVMREIKQMRADAIAAHIGVDYTTTRWRIHQARKLFRREWVSRYGEPD